MRLTRKKALEICRDLWKWLAKNPPPRGFRSRWEHKRKWPGFKKVGKMEDDCPCCQFSIVQQKNQCFSCPLQILWGNDSLSCLDPPSPYRKWCYGPRSRLFRNATIIANAAAKELRKLKRK